MNFEVRSINIDVIVKPRRIINSFLCLSTKKMGYIAYSFQPVGNSGREKFQLPDQRQNRFSLRKPVELVFNRRKSPSTS